MQKQVDRETTIQAIRMCESSGLTGTANALREILDELIMTNQIGKSIVIKAGKGRKMNWIDDVLNDLQRFCFECGYSEIEKKIEETRKVCYAELENTSCMELPSRTGSAPTSENIF